MENIVTLSQVQASGGLENCSSPLLTYLHGRISELQRNLYDAIIAPKEDTQLIEKLCLERDVLDELIHWRTKRDQHESQCLQNECNSHAMTTHELLTERQFHLQTAEANAELRQALETQQQMHQGTIIELNNLRSWCSWVNSMFDFKGLVEGRTGNESWNFEEMIRNIESKVTKHHQKLLQERDDHIIELQNELERLSYKPRRAKQRQSPITKPVPIAKKQPA